MGGGRVGLAVPFDALEQAYARPPGWYHTLDHVKACLLELDLARDLAEEPDAVELALWFHDAIYDPRAKDNEERSAELLTASVSHRLTDEAERLILVTKHAQTPSDTNAKLMVDIDLSILGKPEGVFDLYERQIRTEYAWVTEADYRTGRSTVLRSFLDRPSIYSTETFRKRYEDEARRNLARSLSRLFE